MTGMIEWGQKSKPQKIPRASNKTRPKKSLDQKLAPKKSHAESLSLSRRTRRSGFSVGTITILQTVLNSQNNPYLLIKPPQKNSCQILLPKKILESKISNPPKSCVHPCHLKSEYPPWGFLGRFGLKTGIDFAYRIWFSREQR